MNKTQEQTLNRIVRAHQAVYSLVNARIVHMVDEKDVVVPQRTLEMIEPDPAKWDYKRVPNVPKRWWASMRYKGVMFKTLLTDEAHLDLGGHGIQ